MKIIKIKAKREQSSRHFIQCLWFLIQLDYAQHNNKIKLEFRPASLHRLDSSDFKTTKIITSLDWTDEKENQKNRSQEMNTPNEEIRTKRMRARWSRNRNRTRMSNVSAQKRILDVRVNVSWLHPDTKIIHTSKSAFVDEAKVKLSRERDSLV